MTFYWTNIHICFIWLRFPKRTISFTEVQTRHHNLFYSFILTVSNRSLLRYSVHRFRDLERFSRKSILYHLPFPKGKKRDKRTFVHRSNTSFFLKINQGSMEFNLILLTNNSLWWYNKKRVHYMWQNNLRKMRLVMK